ncbi:MAG: cereblon family protein [Desulfobacterales bacterium]|nr:cereblon family protein [Desulfobacterales bacterium]
MLNTYFFKTSLRNGNSQADIKEAEKAQEEEKEAPFFFCRQCLNPITPKSARISINGAYQHTFANPHGIVFDIGCFKEAEGCGAVGTPTDEFVWFAGYMWQVALCRACLTHMGWFFTSADTESFFGLILDRLIEYGD